MGTRPSLILWRWRHLIAAICVGAAVMCTLGVLRPAAAEPHRVLVLSRPVEAGEVLEDKDVDERDLPALVLPEEGLATSDIVGQRIALSLPAGTILTTAMTAGAASQDLGQDERLVQIPIDIGASLAMPGARVDIVGEEDRGTIWARNSQDTTSEIHPTHDALSAESSGDSADTSSPATGGVTPTTTLCSGARVISVDTPESTSSWAGKSLSGTIVTLVTLAVPKASAPIIVTAATRGALGLVVSP